VLIGSSKRPNFWRDGSVTDPPFVAKTFGLQQKTLGKMAAQKFNLTKLRSRARTLKNVRWARAAIRLLLPVAVSAEDIKTLLFAEQASSTWRGEGRA